MPQQPLADTIKQSHADCKAIGLNPNQKATTISAQKDANASELNPNEELLSNGSAVIREYLKPSDNSIILISDAAGAILKIYGTSNSTKELQKIHISEGSLLSEEYMGTNAIALAIKLKQVSQVSNKEHYLEALKHCTTTATPIFNYNSRLIGVIGIIEFQESAHAYTHNMIKMAANSIADKYWNKLYQKKLNDERQFAFNIMNNLSYGLFAINLNEKIHWVNDTACRSLNIRRTELLRINVEDLVPRWTNIKKQLDKDALITDEEFNLNINNTEEKYILNAYSVKDLNSKIVGYVLTMRPYSRMIKMLGRYSLNNSYFTFKNIIGQSEAIKHAIEIAKTAAASPSTILITGESGTGKEVFAQAIHNRSNRKENNFIAINCGAISSSLIESELFGYEEGAFTGALKKGRPGKFELANKGTLFLDEIGEMPLEMQVKLLRAIQEKTITRVGGSKEIAIDVRIVAATNKNLQEEMKRGTFRSDLFYRLSVIPIHLPSLKHRPEDIPQLIQFFLKQKGQLLTKPIPQLSEEVMSQLVNYSWPGNVRELENTMEKLVLFDGQLDTYSFSNAEEHSEKVPPPHSDITHTFTPKLLDEAEKDTIEKTLHHFKWNISKTANTLGIGRNTLYDKIKKYSIKRDSRK